MEASVTELGHWSIGAAIRRLRDDVNLLAWLYAEQLWLNRNKGETVEGWHGKAHTSLEGPTA